jgi:hypothetical protein
MFPLVSVVEAQSNRSDPKSAPTQNSDSKSTSKTNGSKSADSTARSLDLKSSAKSEDKVEDIQSFNTYTSLEDGQPGQRGELQINYFNGWQTTSHQSDPWLMLMEIEFSPKGEGSWLLGNAKFGIDVPFEIGNGAVDGNGDVTLIWKQRLTEEQEGGGSIPTMTIENELRLPSGYQSSGVDWTLQGVVAKEAGPGTAVLNAFLKSANGHNNLESASWWGQVTGESSDELEHFQWGFRLGYKWRLTDSFAIVSDYINQNSAVSGNRNQNMGEVAVEWRVNDHLTIGPGTMFGLDGAEDTLHFGAGVLIHYSWE